MEKYIKLKDKIIDLEDYKNKFDLKEDKDKFYAEPLTEYSTIIYKKDIIEQSNNLAELFDEIIRVFTDKDCEWKPMLVKYQEHLLEKNNHQDYGALWCKGIYGSWRLEPIAKLNNEGEWELL